jgi:[protein-PII] uridylyltransferase
MAPAPRIVQGSARMEKNDCCKEVIACYSSDLERCRGKNRRTAVFDREVTIVSAYRERLENMKAEVGRTNVLAAGGETVSKFTRGIDELVRQIFLDATAGLPSPGRAVEGLAVLALGGYGRGELNLFSDIDLLFLIKPGARAGLEEIIRRFLYPLWDLKIEVGYSVRTQRECLAMIGKELKSTTALLENRWLLGDRSAAKELDRAVAEKIRSARVSRWFVRRRLEAIDEQHKKYSSPEYLLQPDLKEGPGGLRDIHFFQWMNFLLGGRKNSLEFLRSKGILGSDEITAVEEAREFFLKMRNQMHVQEGRRVDVLSFDRQNHVARQLGYPSSEVALPEENLMHDCIRHSRSVSRALELVVEQLTLKTSARKVNISPDLYVQDHKVFPIMKTGKAPARMRNGQGLMEMFCDAGKRSDATPSAALRSALRRSVRQLRSFDFRSDPAVGRRFLEIFNMPHADAIVRAMHDTGYLSAYVPEVEKLDCLVKIDFYHKYPVDEHLLRAVDESSRMRRMRRGEEASDLSQLAARIRRWDLLNVALLLHDIGKGEGTGHVLRGGQITQRIISRIGLNENEQKMVRWLVMHHQRMSHLAQRRDLDDPRVIEELAREVGSLEILDMLYALTCCDIKAIGPDAWTTWKGQLLHELHRKAAQYLQGVALESIMEVPVTEDLTAEVKKHLGDDRKAVGFVEEFLHSVPRRYLGSMPPNVIAEHVRLRLALDEKTRVVWWVHQPEGVNYSELSVCTADRPGVFSKICGALSSKGMNILGAQIFTTTDGFAVDNFQVTDFEGNRLPPGFRLDRLRSDLNSIILGEKSIEDLPRHLPKRRALSHERKALFPVKVEVNNTASEEYTVIEIRALDRPWLLYTITSKMAEEGLNIDLAIITTESYRVVDVFYVTDLENNKIEDEKTVEQLKASVTKSLEE